MQELTADQLDLFAHIDALIPDHGHLRYDFRDPKQYSFAVMMTELSDHADRYPGALRTLERIKADHDQYDRREQEEELSLSAGGWIDMFAIPGLGLAEGVNTVASNGIATVVGGYSSMNLTLVVQNNQSKSIVAHGFNNDFAGKMLPVATAVDRNGSTDLDVTSYLHYSYTGQTGDSAAASQSSGVAKRVASEGATADPTISAPVRTTTAPLNPNAINIGLGRPWTDQGGSTQFDYAWNEPPENRPIGKIPFVGSVTFTEDIKSPLVPHTGLVLDIYVADKSGGGGSPPLHPTDLNTVYAAFSIDPQNPKTLRWNLPPGRTTHDPGNPIVFSQVTWPSDLEAFFYCGITVVLADGNLGFAAVQSRTTQDDDDLDGILEIRPIEFIWHCIGEGARVSMADGSNKLIERVLAGDEVMTSGGLTTVVWTNKGAHKGDVVRIVTDAGTEIVASDNHVVMTKDGAQQASELEVGTELVTSGAAACVVEVTTHATYDGLMYNVATRDFQAADDHDGEIATFFANGLLVGDINAQRALVHQRSHDIGFVKSMVPSYLHGDVEAFFAAKGA